MTMITSKKESTKLEKDSPRGEDMTMTDAKYRFEYGLCNFFSVLVCVMYHPLVVLPEYLRSDDWIAGTSLIPLEYGFNMPVPISDLKIAEDGVSATLSFSRIPFRTYVPWEAVVSIEGLRVVEPKPPEKMKPKLTLVP